jgi:hypothetical protein
MSSITEISTSDNALCVDEALVEVGYRFPFSQVYEESQKCRILSVQPIFIVVKGVGFTKYKCPIDYTTLFTEYSGICRINMPNDIEAWYHRETCPSGCNHFRWFIFRKDEILKIGKRGKTILASDNIIFVLEPRRKGFPAPFNPKT